MKRLLAFLLLTTLAFGQRQLINTNNLSDVSVAATARTNLAVPGLATANTFTGIQTFNGSQIFAVDAIGVLTFDVTVPWSSYSAAGNVDLIPSAAGTANTPHVFKLTADATTRTVGIDNTAGTDYLACWTVPASTTIYVTAVSNGTGWVPVSTSPAAVAAVSTDLIYASATSTRADKTVTAAALVSAALTAVPATVAQGGTGLATLTDESVMVGNGTGNVTFVAPGTSGNVLTSNGTVWASTAAAAGTASDVQVFDADNTWTKPSGSPKYVTVIAWGGGGGGGGSEGAAALSDKSGGAGGGGGARTTQTFSAAMVGNTVTVTVGAAGTFGAGGSSAGGSAGGIGGLSSFGTLVLAGGGGGGGEGLNGANTAGGGGGGGAYTSGASGTGAGTAGSGGTPGTPSTVAISGTGSNGNSSASNGNAEYGGAGGGYGASGAASAAIAGSSLWGGGAGGGGGGVAAAGTIRVPGAGGASNKYTNGGGGAAGTGGGLAGTAGDAAGTTKPSGAGGGGGYPSETVTGGAGGTGGFPGGGGGGGGAGVTVGGAGGVGGAGRVIVITTY